jgi:chorismate mutase/prephenate dehydratase
MAIARRIAAVKAKSHASIYDADREQAVLSEAGRALSEDCRRAESLMRTIMRLSRSTQYEQLLASGQDFELGRQIQAAPVAIPPLSRIAYQGTVGSYSSQACQILFPDAYESLRTLRTATFAEACDRVHDGSADAAVLPLENSTAGSVDDVYDLLLKHRLFVWRSLDLPVNHYLLGLAGAQLDDIRTVVSHPQALAQCSEIIRQRGWIVQEAMNTAFAAEAVAAQTDRSIAAIASQPAAEAFGLEVLLPAINNAAGNQTRFIAIGRDLVITPDASRVSLILRVPHQSGALAQTLAVFADRNLNLTKIESRPDPESPWTYLFYLDFACGADDRAQALAALLQLTREMPMMRLLGWYGEMKMPEGRLSHER